MATPKKVNVKTELAKWESPDRKIAVAKKKYMEMKVIDEHDETGYDLVKDGLKEVVSMRTGIDKMRKGLKRILDNESGRLLKQIEPIEAHLKEQKSKRDEFLAAEKKRKEDEERARIEKENERLAKEAAEKEEENRKLREQLESMQNEKKEAEDLFGTEEKPEAEQPTVIIGRKPVDTSTIPQAEEVVTPYAQGEEAAEIRNYLERLNTLMVPRLKSGPGRIFMIEASTQIQKIVNEGEKAIKELMKE